MSNTKELNVESVAASHEEVTVRDGKVEKVHKLIVRLDENDPIVLRILTELESLRAKLNRIA